MRSHKPSFTFAITCISRALALRDRVLGWVGPGAQDTPGLSITRFSIPSGANLLDAVFVAPADTPPRAALLICHGIGETVAQWFPVQQLLAANGVVSLLFDYSGFGRSTGAPDWVQYDLDALTAFRTLQRLAPGVPNALLGFSLGSGPAAAIVNTAAPNLLVLCSAFTSFRAGAHARWIPQILSPLVPPIWQAHESLRNCRVPVLIVHGEKDGLFPVQMARDLVACCPEPAELIVVPNVTHNQPFRKPELSYWNPIIRRLIASAE
jgi:alpha-beta hydrolase superfamily lysophospholipase